MALLALLLLLVGVTWLITRGSGSISRRELGWFATQYGVAVTHRSGSRLLAYLARTRRWRVFGALGAISVSVSLMILFRSNQSINLLAALFGGWFAGGILAEVHVGKGSRRVGEPPHSFTEGPRATSRGRRASCFLRPWPWRRRFLSFVSA